LRQLTYCHDKQRGTADHPSAPVTPLNGPCAAVVLKLDHKVVQAVNRGAGSGARNIKRWESHTCCQCFVSVW